MRSVVSNRLIDLLDTLFGMRRAFVRSFSDSGYECERFLFWASLSSTLLCARLVAAALSW